MILAVIILASLLVVTAAAFGACVRVFVTAPGERALMTVHRGIGTETWAWRPWRGWHLIYRVTVDSTYMMHTLHESSTTVAA